MSEASPRRWGAIRVVAHSGVAQVAFEAVVEILCRLPDFRIDGEVERFHDSGDVCAIRQLPITFTRGPRSDDTRFPAAATSVASAIADVL